ncbi:hypothetical protein E2C01_008514 [Portunus trituberculatus]|uniref:Uncharacterized protein n=1 Tax=Portunus trituberculatus TaxID=210409 RepID=A0A5B7D324_PORTR|nr:hypothetical protein [Portunus trituberculatus]
MEEISYPQFGVRNLPPPGAIGQDIRIEKKNAGCCFVNNSLQCIFELPPNRNVCEGYDNPAAIINNILKNYKHLSHDVQRPLSPRPVPELL